MEAVIRKWGNSPALRLPSAVMKSAALELEQHVTITATTIAAPIPMNVIIGMPATARPQIAITTVPPAMSTAWPAVAIERPEASSTVRPRCSPARCRVMMKRA